jgi:type I restriction enzyme M protein
VSTIVTKTEKELWGLCNDLRPKMEASEYKHVVLRVYSLVAINLIEPKGRQLPVTIPDCAKTENLLSKLKNGLGSNIASAANYVDDVMVQLSKANNELEDCFPPVFERLLIDDDTMVKMIEQFADILGKEKDPSIIYQYFLRKFAESEGRGGGEFFTPDCILDVMTQMLNFKKGVIYEPCFGGGTMIVKSHKQAMEENGSEKQVLEFYGQEANPVNFRLGKIHFFLEDIKGDWRMGDTLLNDQFPHKHADGAIANPPFNIKNWSNETILKLDGKTDIPVDKRWRDWGLPPKTNANFAWMSHINRHCKKESGLFGVIFSNGTLSNKASSTLRKQMIVQDRVVGVLALPSQLFTNTAIPSAIWFVGEKNNDQRGKTMFIDARKKGKLREDSRTLKELSNDDIQSIVKPFRQWIEQPENYLAMQGAHNVVSNEEILHRNENAYCNPGRFIESDETDELVENEDVLALLEEIEGLQVDIGTLHTSIVASFDND